MIDGFFFMFIWLACYNVLKNISHIQQQPAFIIWEETKQGPGG